ncbi:hypothetical protein ACF06D_01565 [Streptomyces griseoluteus]|uniref:hypothetical protein n=1 Tax=Streptomyces TaxID=1883 RepID=UPI000A3CFC63|nr:hypothetical protein [Streptomyces recifensis]
MRHCDRPGRPSCDEPTRHLRATGEDLAASLPHELTYAPCGLGATHAGPHAGHLGETGRTRLRVPPG